MEVLVRDGERERRGEARGGNTSTRLRDESDDPVMVHKTTIRVSIASNIGKWAALLLPYGGRLGRAAFT